MSNWLVHFTGWMVLCLVASASGQDPAARSRSLPAREAPGEDSGTLPWQPLFNGIDLAGWTVKIRGCEAGVNFADTFRVDDGILKVCYDGYESFDERYGHLFCDREFSHYVLRVEYCFVGDQVPGGPGWAWRNSGVMLHGQTPQSMSLDQNFPVSVEAQFLGGNGRDQRHTLNVCTPGTHIVIGDQLIRRHCTDSSSETFHGDQWVTATIEVRGSRLIRHFVNGVQVLEYARPQLDPDDADAARLGGEPGRLLESGTISLQSESHPVWFRKVELLELAPDEATPEAALGTG